MSKPSAVDHPRPVPLPRPPATAAVDGQAPGVPAPLTQLIGRERELAAVGGLLRDGARLLTLTGPGGVGKTRLAVEVAHVQAARFADGVAFVPLAAIRDPALVAGAIAAVLGAEPDARSPRDALVAHLRPRRLLLVLDNFEQVLPAPS